MKHIGQFIPQVLDAVVTMQSGTAIALCARPAPLVVREIEKIEVALERYAAPVQKAIYGSVPVVDQNGNVYRHEFDVTGYETVYTITAGIPPALIEAIQRPTVKAHVVYHLTRLAAHLRDTRGSVVSAVFEDIAHDIGTVSEWAVICACKELRQGENKWFPATGDLIETIRRHQRQIDRMIGELS